MARKPISHRDFTSTPVVPGQPKAKKKPPAGVMGKGDGYWWKETEDIAGAVFRVVKFLDSQQGLRVARNRRNMYLYGNTDVFGIAPGTTRSRTGNPFTAAGSQRVTYNIIRMASDTLAAKIAKSKPRVTFITDGGDWDQQQRAKGLTKFVDGQFYECGVRETAPQCFIDGCVKDAGVMHFYRVGSRIYAERVNPDELYVDELDGLHGNPRQMHRVKLAPREVLKEMYPQYTAAIEDAPAPSWPTYGLPMRMVQTLSDYVQVVESWHLPSGEDAEDGRHVIAIEGQHLVDEEWKRRRFPFSFFFFARSMEGFWGQGVAERLRDRQLNINKLLKAIHGMLHLCSVPRYYVEETSKVVSAHLNNEIGAIIKFRGQAPALVAANAVPTELFQAVEREKASGLEEIGVSQLSVAAQKPAGLNSGQALRDFSDIESERFVLVGQAWESFHLDCGRQIIDLAREISADPKHKKNFDVAFTSKGSVERVKWDDVHLDEDSYVMKMFPTSSLPQTPAARRQTISEWQQSGWIDGVEARYLLDLPDLEDSDNDALAAYENIRAAVQCILNGEEYEAPEPYQDLQLGLKKFQSAYLRSKRLKAPARVLNNLQLWIDTAQSMLADAQPKPAPTMAPPGMPGAPPGPGGPPPGMGQVAA